MTDGPYFESAEEANESVRQAMEQAKASFVDFQHRMVGMLDHLSSDDLEVFAQFALSCVGNGHNAIFYHGFATAIRTQKYGVCAGCGEDHDQVLQNIANQGKESQSTEAVEDAPELEKDQMELYLLEPNPDFPDTDPHQYRCINCGKGYISVEDRMLRDPGTGGCGGCIDKEKWGSRR